MAGKRVSNVRRASWAIGAVVLLSTLGVSCTSGGGGGCGRPTEITGGYPPSEPIAGWYSYDTRANGNVTVNDQFGAPPGFGCYSAELTTGASTPTPPASLDKAQLFSFAKAGSPFAPLNNVSYWAYRSSLSGTPAANIALNIELYGVAGFTPAPGHTCAVATPCFTSLVYEPYLQSGGQGAITNDVWQHWNATDATPGNGMWWSSHITSGPGSQGQPQTWSWFKTQYPDAVLGGYGFNVGSNNPNMFVAADGLTLGSTTTNF
jgi:hypothetical protein